MDIKGIAIRTIRSGRGDCIHLRFAGDSGMYRNIMIDTGPTYTSGEFRILYESIIRREEIIDVLFITHYDDDHIGGILKLVADQPALQIDKAIFNAYQGDIPFPFLSAVQGQRLFHKLITTDVEYMTAEKGDVFSFDGAQINIIAPSKGNKAGVMQEMEKADVSYLNAVSDWDLSIDQLMNRPLPSMDDSISNRASIAFTFEYRDARILFCGDANASSLIEGLKGENALFDLVKLPHHGSNRNISDELLELISADQFLICADGTSHPSKQTIVKLLQRYGIINVIGNYEWWNNGFLLPEDMKYKDKLTFSLC